MKAKDLLTFIPDEELVQLAAKTRVDHQVKKLSGRVMFQQLLSLLQVGLPPHRAGEASSGRQAGVTLGSASWKSHCA